LTTLRESLLPAGIDIVEALPAESYNDRVTPLNPALAVPLLNNDEGATTMMIMVGNSRAVWQPFLSWCGRNWLNNPSNEWQGQEALSQRGIYDGEEHDGLMCRGFHPFDSFLTENITSAVERTKHVLQAEQGEQFSTQTYYSYDTAHGKLLAAQHAAAAAGVAYVEPVSHLSLHPEFGPWWSIRAAIVCSLPGPPALTAARAGSEGDEGGAHREEIHITPEQHERVRVAAARAMAEAPMYNGTYTGESASMQEYKRSVPDPS
jgi:hypothetical protein